MDESDLSVVELRFYSELFDLWQEDLLWEDVGMGSYVASDELLTAIMEHTERVRTSAVSGKEVSDV